MSKIRSSHWRLNTLTAAGGTLGSAGAFVGASCCVLPVLLVQAGIASGLVARLAWFAQQQAWFFWGAAAALALSLTIALMRGTAARAFWLWWIAGALVLAASQILPRYEMIILDWIRPS